MRFEMIMIWCSSSCPRMQKSRLPATRSPVNGEIRGDTGKVRVPVASEVQ
jgi:hypothetical protein